MYDSEATLRVSAKVAHNADSFIHFIAKKSVMLSKEHAQGQ